MDAQLQQMEALVGEAIASFAQNGQARFTRVWLDWISTGLKREEEKDKNQKRRERPGVTRDDHRVDLDNARQQPAVVRSKVKCTWGLKTKVPR